MNPNIRYYHSWKQKFGENGDPADHPHAAGGLLINLYPRRDDEGRLAVFARRPRWASVVRKIIHIIACLVILGTVLFGLSLRA